MFLGFKIVANVTIRIQFYCVIRPFDHPYALFAYSHIGVRLLLRGDEHVVDIDVCGLADDPTNYLGYVAACQWSNAAIDALRALRIAVETYHRELRFDHSGAHFAHLNSVRNQIRTHRLRDGVHGVLRGTIDCTVLVGLSACDRAEIDDMAATRLDHSARNDACNVEQTLDIGVDHRVPILGRARVDMLQTSGQTRIIDQYIDRTLVRNLCQMLLASLFVAYIEDEVLHLDVVYRADFGSHIFEAVSASSGENQVVAHRGQFSCGSLADTRRCARDECKFCHKILSFWTKI